MTVKKIHTDDWSPEKRARVRDTLRAALKLIVDKKRWTQHRMAADARGESVPTRSKKAVAFCAAGAVWRSSGGGRGVQELAIATLDELGKLDIVDINDLRGHVAVIKRFRKAIAALAPKAK